MPKRKRQDRKIDSMRKKRKKHGNKYGEQQGKRDKPKPYFSALYKKHLIDQEKRAGKALMKGSGSDGIIQYEHIIRTNHKKLIKEYEQQLGFLTQAMDQKKHGSKYDFNRTIAKLYLIKRGRLQYEIAYFYRCIIAIKLDINEKVALSAHFNFPKKLSNIAEILKVYSEMNKYKSDASASFKKAREIISMKSDEAGYEKIRNTLIKNGLKDYSKTSEKENPEYDRVTHDIASAILSVTDGSDNEDGVNYVKKGGPGTLEQMKIEIPSENIEKVGVFVSQNKQYIRGEISKQLSDIIINFANFKKHNPDPHSTENYFRELKKSLEHLVNIDVAEKSIHPSMEGDMGFYTLPHPEQRTRKRKSESTYSSSLFLQTSRAKHSAHLPRSAESAYDKNIRLLSKHYPFTDSITVDTTLAKLREAIENRIYAKLKTQGLSENKIKDVIQLQSRYLPHTSRNRENLTRRKVNIYNQPGFEWNNADQAALRFLNINPLFVGRDAESIDFRRQVALIYRAAQDDSPAMWNDTKGDNEESIKTTQQLRDERLDTLINQLYQAQRSFNLDGEGEADSHTCLSGVKGFLALGLKGHVYNQLRPLNSGNAVNTQFIRYINTLVLEASCSITIDSTVKSVNALGIKNLAEFYHNSSYMVEHEEEIKKEKVLLACLEEIYKRLDWDFFHKRYLSEFYSTDYDKAIKTVKKNYFSEDSVLTRLVEPLMVIKADSLDSVVQAKQTRSRRAKLPLRPVPNFQKPLRSSQELQDDSNIDSDSSSNYKCYFFKLRDNHSLSNKHKIEVDDNGHKIKQQRLM